VWGYEFDDTSFKLYFQDEFLTGNYHFPIEFYHYGELSTAIMDNIPQEYEYPIRYAKLPMWIETAQFRGKEKNSRFEISVAMPDSICSSIKDSWETIITLFDSDWNRISTSAHPFRSDTLLRIERDGKVYSVHSTRSDLFPRPLGYVVTMEVVNERSSYRGIHSLPVEIKDFHGRFLKLSSIKFNVLDENGSRTDVLNPMPIYSHNGNLDLSYEIYNLKRGEDNRARYRLTYAIKAPEEQPSGIRKTLSYMWSSIRGGEPQDAPYISSTIEQSINRSTVSDYIQIDLGTLELGKYLLVLTVEDVIGGRSATEERVFIITN
jgi:hypothetical protein